METAAPAAGISAPTGDVAPSAAPIEQPVINAQPQETAAPKWHEGYSMDNQEYVTNKGFQDSESVLNSYRNLEKLRGVSEDKLLKLPDDMSSPEMKGIYQKLGMPDKPGGYELQKDGRDPNTASWASEKFHELGLSKDQAHQVMDGFDEYLHGQGLDQQDAHASKMDIEHKDLKREWGLAFDKNIAVARRAAEAFEIDDATLGTLENNMGLGQLMKFLNKVGTKMGEDPYVQGSPIPNGTLTPDQAKSRISFLKKDNTFTSKWLAQDPEARSELSKLNKMAYPE